MVTPSTPDIGLALIGITGSGKSASGNTIVGRQHFYSEQSFSSETMTCQTDVVTLPNGKSLMVVDTPGFFDTNLPEDIVHTEIARCLNLCTSGLHAFLFVVAIGRRYTEESEKVVAQMVKVFEEEAVRDYGLVLFTHGDHLSKPIEDYLQTAPDGLKALLGRCGNRYHVFNNNDLANRDQVRGLLEKVEGMVQKNGGKCYDNELLRKAKALIQRKMEAEALQRQMDQPQTAHSSESLVSMFRQWMKAANSPEVLEEVKMWVKAILAGAAIGAVIGATLGVGSVVVAGLAMSEVAGLGAAGAAGAALGATIGGIAGAVIGPEELHGAGLTDKHKQQ